MSTLTNHITDRYTLKSFEDRVKRSGKGTRGLFIFDTQKGAQINHLKRLVGDGRKVQYGTRKWQKLTVKFKESEA